MDLRTVLIGKFPAGKSSADRYHRNQIMPAAMPESRQSVVFRKECDLRPQLLALIDCFVGGCDAAKIFFDRKAMFGQQLFPDLSLCFPPY